MAKQRRLTDLYVVGEEVTLDDGAGDPITVFVRKLNPVDHETAIRRSNAARARAAAIKNRQETEEYQEIVGQVDEMDRDGIVSWLLEDERARITPAVEAEHASEEEWSKDNYLQGLRDVWEDEAKERYHVDKDPDAVHVYEELKRYDAIVTEDIQARLDAFEDDLNLKGDENLHALMFDKYLQLRVSMAWLNEFRRCELWLSVRETNRKTRYFTSRDEVDDLPFEVFTQLQDAYRNLSVDPLEGKGLRVTDSSLDSSEQPAKPEMEPSSGPADAAA